MRKLYTLAMCCTLALAFTVSARADAIPITNNGDGTDDNFNDVTGGGNANIILFEWLKGEILSWNNNRTDRVLPDPTEALTIYEGAAALGPIEVVQGDYLVLHYGAGPNGTPGSGGGLVAYYVTDTQTFNAPATGDGPNGTGGLSFVRLWDHDRPPGGGVPDGGVTMLLLGSVLTGFGLLRRKLS